MICFAQTHTRTRTRTRTRTHTHTHTRTRTRTRAHTHTLKTPTAGDQLVGHTSKKTIYTQLFQYLTLNSLLRANQYGFRAKYSTELALIELVDRIYSQLDETKYLHPYLWTCQKHLTPLIMKSLSVKWNMIEYKV